MPLDLANPDRTIHAGVILMGETEILDVAPIDMLNAMSKNFLHILPVPDEIKARALDMEFHWVTEDGRAAPLTSNMKLNATDSFKTCPVLDIVLIGAHDVKYTPNDAELAFIRKSYEDSAAFLTICAGMLPAQLAGVLAGKTCTAPRFMIPQLQKEDPRTTWVEKRYVRDGKVWTSGTLLNGLDLVRHFVTEYWPDLAKEVVPLGGWPERSVEY